MGEEGRSFGLGRIHGQVMLHFRSVATLCVKDCTADGEAALKAKALTVARLWLQLARYGSTNSTRLCCSCSCRCYCLTQSYHGV